MTDLNELSQFEKDLKNLIEERNNLFNPKNIEFNSSYKPKKMSEEEKNRLYEMGKLGMFMGIPEHGRPYEIATTSIDLPEHGRSPRIKDMSFMGIPEHGRPHKRKRTR